MLAEQVLKVSKAADLNRDNDCRTLDCVRKHPWSLIKCWHEVPPITAHPVRELVARRRRKKKKAKLETLVEKMTTLGIMERSLWGCDVDPLYLPAPVKHVCYTLCSSPSWSREKDIVQNTLAVP